MGMQFPSPVRVSHLKPIWLAVFLLIALLYVFPKHDLSRSTGALQALKPSVSHYSDEYRHNSSHDEPAAPPPSFDFIDLSKLDTASLSNAHYNPYVESNGIWRSSRKPCVGPRGVDVNGNPDDMLLAYAVSPPSTHRFPCAQSNSEIFFPHHSPSKLIHSR